MGFENFSSLPWSLTLLKGQINNHSWLIEQAESSLAERNVLFPPEMCLLTWLSRRYLYAGLGPERVEFSQRANEFTFIFLLGPYKFSWLPLVWGVCIWSLHLYLYVCTVRGITESQSWLSSLHSLCTWWEPEFPFSYEPSFSMRPLADGKVPCFFCRLVGSFLGSSSWRGWGNGIEV